MDLTKTFSAFSAGKSWHDKVLEADKIWAQVKEILNREAQTLPKTPRRPDVRMIIENISGHDQIFKNPGDHSGSKEELIPAAGDKKAAMVMVKGETLAEQYKNAQTIYERYDMGTKGLSDTFVADMKAGKLSDLLAEAYGPAPFAPQAEKLVDVAWKSADGSEENIIPVKGSAAAFGARAATEETVFLAKFHIFVKGTGTTAELVESDGMAIAVSEDWKTKAETTRPIVPSVAATYYGEHFAKIPQAVIHPDGMLKEILIQTPRPPTPPKDPATPKP